MSDTDSVPDTQLPTSALKALATSSFASMPTDDVVRGACGLAVELVGGDSASVAVRVDATWRSLGATDEMATRADACQHVTADGPAVEAVNRGEPVLVHDLAATQWRAAPNMVAAGVHSVLSVPLAVNKAAFGALNLYGRAVGALDDADVNVASAVATHIAVTAANAVSYAEVTRLADELQDAMLTRAVIEQAKGIVMSALGCSADEAFRVLVTQSQHENRKLREIATELVERSQRPRPENGRDN